MFKTVLNVLFCVCFISGCGSVATWILIHCATGHDAWNMVTFNHIQYNATFCMTGFFGSVLSLLGYKYARSIGVFVSKAMPEISIKQVLYVSLMGSIIATTFVWLNSTVYWETRSLNPYALKVHLMPVVQFSCLCSWMIFLIKAYVRRKAA